MPLAFVLSSGSAFAALNLLPFPVPSFLLIPKLWSTPASLVCTPLRERPSMHGFNNESVLCLWQYSSSHFPHATSSSACGSVSPLAPEYIFYLDVTITTQISEYVSAHHLCFQSAIDVPFGRQLTASLHPLLEPSTHLLAAELPPSESDSPSLNMTFKMSDCQ